MTTDPPVPEPVLALAHRLFEAPTASYGPYEIRSGITVVHDALYELLVRSGGKMLTVSLFTGIDGDLAGQLWEQEVRVLLRVGRLRHRALPEIVSGGYDADEQAAWIVVPRPELRLDVTVTEYFNDNPGPAIRHFLELADALSVLHSQGVVHRNLWPGAVFVEVDRLTDSEHPRLDSMSLGRFEASSLISNLLRRAGADPSGRANAARQLFLDQGDEPLDSLRYFAPERLDSLLGSESAGLHDTDRADVFSLGAIVWEWFFGPMPAREVITSRVAGPALRQQLLQLHNVMRARLGDPQTPRPLADLLDAMLRSDPRTRATSAEVAAALIDRYHTLISLFEDVATSGLLLAFMPKDMRHSLHHEFKWAQLDATTEPGQREIRKLIEEDLSGALLTYSPSGADGYLTSEHPEKLREGQYVLVGKRATWFCRLYERAPRAGGALSRAVASESLPNVMLIRHAGLNRDARIRELGARALTDAGLHRLVSSVVAIPGTDERLIDDEQRDRPSWKPLMASVVRDDPAAVDHDFTNALEFLLDLQSAELMLREYPYRRTSPTYDRYAALEFDADRALTATRGNDLFSLLVRDRSHFGDFFVADAAVGLAGEMECRADEGGRPAAGRQAVGWNVIKRDETSIILDRGEGRPPVVPERGWIRPAGDRAADTGIRRQRIALRELLDQRGLLTQLQHPSSIATSERRWRNAGAELEGGADAVVRRMLSTEPFFAVHGPPGTGKTTVVAHAVEAFLRAEPGARVLVSAQANDALDHLGLQILDRLRRGGGLSNVTSLRIGRNEERIHRDMRRWRIEDLTQSVIGQAAGRTRKRLGAGRDPARIAAVLEKWLGAIDQSWVEIGERLERGANLVFATCSGANAQALGRGGPFAAFDWVIVEEAAKAWPTELAVPLVRGVRWTLIGDHRQLPAFRSREVSETLKVCEERATVPALKRAGARRSEYEDTFSLFARMFEREGAPVARLRTQFRMPEPVADAVSDAFYSDDPLRTATRGDPDASTLSMGSESLIWIDTAMDEECREEGRWSNPGEAALIARLVQREGLLNGEGARSRTAILTPWHEQRRRIDQALGTPEFEFVHTVDSFQGQEAEIVICSLVRDKPVASTSAYASLGHDSDPQRVNVMLSRAKRVNVMVGHLERHETCGLEFWETICRHFRQHGRVIDATEVGRR